MSSLEGRGAPANQTRSGSPDGPERLRRADSRLYWMGFHGRFFGMVLAANRAAPPARSSIEPQTASATAAQTLMRMALASRVAAYLHRAWTSAARDASTKTVRSSRAGRAAGIFQ